MSKRLVITDIGFEPDGTTIISYLGADDIRCEGAVAVRRQIRIVPTDQYGPDIEKLVGRARALLTDALEDWEESEPVPAEDLGPERPFESATPDQEEDDEDGDGDRNWQAIEQARQGEQTEVPTDAVVPPASGGGGQAGS